MGLDRRENLDAGGGFSIIVTGVNLLRGDTVQQVSNSLPEEIRLVVVG